MQGPERGVLLSNQTVEQRLAAVEGRLAALEKLLVIAADGGLTIKTATKLSLQAPTVEVKAAMNLGVHSGSNMDFKAGLQLTLSAAGTAAVKAAMLNLNGGTKPLARVGDSVNGNVVVTGSPTILG